MPDVPTQPQITNTTGAFGGVVQIPGSPGAVAGNVDQSTLVPVGGGGGGSGTVTLVSNSDGTIVVSGTPTVAPVVSRAAITGDVSVPATSDTATVTAIHGTTVPATPTSGQVLTATSGTSATWQAPAGGAPTGAAGGDLGGTYPNPSVAAVNGTSVPATPTSGQVLTATGATSATWQAPAGGAPTGTAGGNLSGTYPNPTVAAVNGTTVPATPTSGQVLTATSGTSATWQAPAGGAPTGAAGGDLSGTYPNPTAAKVNGTSVPATPTAGQTLVATSGTAATWEYFPQTAIATTLGTALTLTASNQTLLTLSSVPVGTHRLTVSAVVKMAGAASNTAEIFIGSGGTATYSVTGPQCVDIQETGTGLATFYSAGFTCTVTVTVTGTVLIQAVAASGTGPPIIESVGSINTSLPVTGAVLTRTA